MQIKDIVIVVGGQQRNNETGQPTMVGKSGEIKRFGYGYSYAGQVSRDVYVEFEHFGVHVFSERHLEIV